MTSTEPAPLSIVLDTPPIQARTSVAVDPVVLITTECITVTSAMRKHARWAQSSVAAILGGSSSGYSNVQAAIPPPNPRSTTHPKTGNMKVDGAAVEARIEAPGLNIGSTNRWGLRGKRGKSIQVGLFQVRHGTRCGFPFSSQKRSGIGVFKVDELYDV